METLERAATWSDEEKLIQLAGHQRGKGLQECNGCDKLGPETWSIFLFGQMQDGLCQDLMRSPSISRPLSYQELYMAANNKEKRQEYNNGLKSSTSPLTSAPSERHR